MSGLKPVRRQGQVKPPIGALCRLIPSGRSANDPFGGEVRQPWNLSRQLAVVLILLFMSSEPVLGSWLSTITGVDINVPAGTISFSNPRPDAIPEMLKNLPADVLEFATNCLLTRGVCPGIWMANLVRQAKAQAQGDSLPIPPDIRVSLQGFFPAYILDKARWTTYQPNRSVLESMIFGGGCGNTQFLGLYVSCSNGALTLDNVIIFADQMHEANKVSWAHELTHVSQYDGLGIDGFAFTYTIDPRFTRKPSLRVAGNRASCTPEPAIQPVIRDNDA